MSVKASQEDVPMEEGDTELLVDDSKVEQAPEQAEKFVMTAQAADANVLGEESV